MAQSQQTATGVDPFQLAMQMMSMMSMAAAERNRTRDRDRDNPIAQTRRSNRLVQSPMGGRTGPSKGSGGGKGGAKKRELQEGIAKRKATRSRQKDERIARNTAATKQKQRDAKFRSAEREADRLEADIGKLSSDVDSYVRGVQEGRAAEATQASRDAYYGARPQQQPLDALSLAGEVHMPQVMALQGRTPFTPPPGGVTTEMALGPDPMVDAYRQQDAARFAEAQDAVAQRGQTSRAQYEQQQAMPGPPPPTLLTESAAGNFPKQPIPSTPTAPSPQQTSRTTPPQPGFFTQVGDYFMGRGGSTGGGGYPGLVVPGVTPEEAASGSFRPVDMQGNPRPFDAYDSNRGILGPNPLERFGAMFGGRGNIVVDPYSYGYTAGTYPGRGR